MSAGRQIGILIVEDQEVVRIGLNLSLENHPDIVVLAEVTDGITAVHEAIARKPDVILMDIGLPVMDGIAAATLIKQELATRIIMFTDRDDDQSVFAALSAGADGYCLKDVSEELLVKAIKTVADGAVWLDERVADRVLRSYSQPSGIGGSAKITSTVAVMPVPPVSPKQTQEAATMQQEVLGLVVEGLDANVISQRLRITPDQVNTCLYDAMDGLARSERAQAALGDLRRAMFKDVPGLSKWCPKCQRDLDPHFETCPFDGADLDVPSEEQLMGKTFADRYEILAVLGRGAMGIVYKARHKFMNRIVAIKILHPYLLLDVNNIKRFRHEAEAASALEHPNVIRIFDFGLTSSGEAFLVMEFLEGPTLEDELIASERIPVERALDLFIQCCDALEHAHTKGLIHRDLKPSNIVLTKDQFNHDSVRIVDFGIARFTSKETPSGTPAPNFTQEGVVHGTPAYMSPEQCQAKALDARSDIYSFGCVMYETLSGNTVFQGDHSIDAMYMHVRQEPESLQQLYPELELPAMLDQIILKALAKDPNDRYQTVVDLRRDLLALKTSRKTVNSPGSP
jgi:DNA-binding NarL/FixJ family response regulator/tRNA A-37 threonylcarbamoyl transferase component Bud32